MFESVDKRQTMKNVNKINEKKRGGGKLRLQKFHGKRAQFLRPEVPKEILEVYDNFGPDKGEAPTEIRGRNARHVKHRMLQKEIEKRQGVIETARTDNSLAPGEFFF